jgi:hypothetical protein
VKLFVSPDAVNYSHKKDRSHIVPKLNSNCNSRSLEGNRREYNISEKQWYNSGRRSRRCIVMLV